MKLFIVFAVVMAGLMLPSAGLAADVTFVGPSTSQWSSGTNWSGGSVPGASDNAFLTAGGNQAWLTLSSTFSPTISNLTVSNNLLRMWGNTGVLNVTGSISVTNNQLFVSTSGTDSTYYAIQTPLISANNATLTVLANSWLTAGPSSTWNFGGIDLNTESSSNASNFRINGATVNVSGGNAYGVMLSRGSSELSTLYMDAGTLTAVRIGMGRQQNNFQNSGTGTLQWSGGTIANYSGQDLLLNSYDITDNYGFQVNLTGTADKTLSAASGRTVRFGPNSTNTNSGGAISGTNTAGAYLTGSTGRLVVDGGGTVRLYQSNSYSGAVKVNNGTLTLVSGTETYNSVFGTYNATIAPSALEIATSGTLDLQNGSGLTGSGSISFTGGLLKFSGSTSADLSSRIVNSTGAIRINTGTNNVTFASALASSNSGGLIVDGSGPLTLSGSNTYSGWTLIANNARLNIDGNHSSVGDWNVQPTATLAGSGTINLSNGAFLNVYTTGTSPTFYAIQTPRITTPSGNSNLALYNGAWLTAGPGSTWDFGGIDLNPDNVATRSNFRINGATINVSGPNAYCVMLSRGPNATSTLYMDAGTLTAVRIGIGRQQDNFYNAGTSSTIEWTGGTIANYSGQDMLWNSYDTADNYGLQVNLTGTADKTLSVASGRTARFGPNAINYGASHVLSGTNTTGAYLTGSTGRLVIDGGGTVRLYQNTNSYSGAMKINNGTLTLVSGTETYDSAFGTYNATIAPSALEIATNGTLDLQNGSGLTGSGSLTFTGGLLKFSGSTSADLSSRIVNSTGAIRINTGTNNVTFASALASSNSGGLSKSGAGTLRLTATPAYTGTTSITAGTLDFGPGSGTTTWTNPIVGSSGTFRYSGAGTLVVSSTVNSANSFSGAVVVDSGVLQMGVNDFTPYRGFMNASSFTVNSGATLAITRDAVGVVPMTLNSGTLTTGTIGTGASNGAAQQLGTLTMNAGTIITGKGLNSSYNSFALASDVTVAGSAMSQILAGVGTDNGMHLTNSGSGGSRTFTVNDVTNSSAADLTVSASLLNTFGSLNPANLVKAGLGTMVLSGSNGYTGTTTVSAGRLTVNGGLAGGAVSVAAGAVLAGSGTIGGTVTVSGTLSPGNSPGLLTLSSLVLTSTATTLMEIDGLARGSLYDGINLTTAGGLTYAGVLSIAFGLGSAVPDQTTFDLFSFTGSPTGDFASVTSTGLYAGSWTQVSSGTWSLESGSQTLTFSTATGDIIVVPEPGALVLAGIGAAAAAYALRRRR